MSSSKHDAVNIYDVPIPTKDQVGQGHTDSACSNNSKRDSRISIVIASISLVVALLALIVAMVAIGFSTQRSDLARESSKQDEVIGSALTMLEDKLHNSTEQMTSIENQMKQANYEQNKAIASLNNSLELLQLSVETLTMFEDKLNNSTEQITDQVRQCKQANYEQNEAITSLNSSLLQQLSVGTLSNPAKSCKEISQDKPSGEYWILKQTTSSSSPVKVYCNMVRTSCSCNTDRGWMRIANINMTDPTQSCPVEFKKRDSSRVCGRPRDRSGCVSTTFPTFGVQYSRVCGHIVGYQYASPDGFTHNNDIDSAYVDGISLTHGQFPRQHIWTFAGVNAVSQCPCTQHNGGSVPAFVGHDYFCDTALSEGQNWHSTLYNNNPLWDGQGCVNGLSSCCHFNGPPSFCKQLPTTTTDNIELRICGDDNIDDEDVPFEIVEIYVN